MQIYCRHYHVAVKQPLMPFKETDKKGGIVILFNEIIELQIKRGILRKAINISYVLER